MIDILGEEERNKKIKISMNRKSTHFKYFLNNYLIIDGKFFIVIIKKYILKSKSSANCMENYHFTKKPH